MNSHPDAVNRALRSAVPSRSQRRTYGSDLLDRNPVVFNGVDRNGEYIAVDVQHHAKLSELTEQSVGQPIQHGARGGYRVATADERPRFGVHHYVVVGELGDKVCDCTGFSAFCHLATPWLDG